jgi:hypothetical protein
MDGFATLVTRHMAEIRDAFAEPLARRLGREADDIREGLGAGDFRGDESVRITLCDGSTMELRYAFYVESEDGRRVGVFTEHCGYHVFGTIDLDIEQRRGELVVAERHR